jgi:hypothetical protein
VRSRVLPIAFSGWTGMDFGTQGGKDLHDAEESQALGRIQVGGPGSCRQERQVGAKVTKGTRPFVSREPDRTLAASARPTVLVPTVVTRFFSIYLAALVPGNAQQKITTVKPAHESVIRISTSAARKRSVRVSQLSGTREASVGRVAGIQGMGGPLAAATRKGDSWALIRDPLERCQAGPIMPSTPSPPSAKHRSLAARILRPAVLCLLAFSASPDGATSTVPTTSRFEQAVNLALEEVSGSRSLEAQVRAASAGIRTARTSSCREWTRWHR